MGYVQSTFDLDAETFSEREKLIIRRLGEYRTVDADIRRQQRIISGELTNVSISVTIRPPDEDERDVMQDLDAERWGVDIDRKSEAYREMAKVVKKHVNMDRALYTNRIRVVRALRDKVSNDAEEDKLLQDAYVILAERGEEEAVHLTPAERYVHERQKETERAEAELERLQTLKRVVGYALADLVDYCEEWHTILWYKYVQGEREQKVCERAARGDENNKTPLTPDEYRLARKKALMQFDKWAVGLR